MKYGPMPPGPYLLVCRSISSKQNPHDKTLMVEAKWQIKGTDRFIWDYFHPYQTYKWRDLVSEFHQLPLWLRDNTVLAKVINEEQPDMRGWGDEGKPYVPDIRTKIESYLAVVEGE